MASEVLEALYNTMETIVEKSREAHTSPAILVLEDLGLIKDAGMWAYARGIAVTVVNTTGTVIGYKAMLQLNTYESGGTSVN